MNSEKGIDTEPNIKLRANNTTPTATIAMVVNRIGAVRCRSMVGLSMDIVGWSHFGAKIRFYLIKG